MDPTLKQGAVKLPDISRLDSRIDTVNDCSSENSKSFRQCQENSSSVNNDIADSKANKGTSTEIEDSKSTKCKYCMLRLSKLRQLEKMKKSKAMAEHAHCSSNPKFVSQKKDRGCQTSASLFEQAEMTQKELRSLAMILRFRDEKPLRTETFCKCVLHGRERDCRCGEEEDYFEWVWDSTHRGPATNLQERGRQVIFHKDYSCGTTAVRGQQPMHNDQHFWEIKMTTPVYGTDMMVGVGTDHVDLSKFHNTFCSMLGYDMESWGISYDGRVQHSGRKFEYCSRFGQGAIIGVHLDMWHGTLAFFKNRQSLGTVFTGLRGRTLYPMACSTAARSGMRVISSRSFPTSLQFMCCRLLRQFVPAHLSVLNALAMPPGLRAFLANNMMWLLDVPHTASAKPSSGYICPICLPLKSVFEGCTDDEDSGDEGRNDHVHDLINLDSEDDSDDGDDVSMDVVTVQDLISSVMPGVRNRSVASDTMSNSSCRRTISRRTRYGVKKSRLVSFPETRLEDLEVSVEEEESSDGSAESQTREEKTETYSLGSQSQSSESTKLGKRKRISDQ